MTAESAAVAPMPAYSDMKAVRRQAAPRSSCSTTAVLSPRAWHLTCPRMWLVSVVCPSHGESSQCRCKAGAYEGAHLDCVQRVQGRDLDYLAEAAGNGIHCHGVQAPAGCAHRGFHLKWMS